MVILFAAKQFKPIKAIHSFVKCGVERKLILMHYFGEVKLNFSKIAK